MLLVVASVNSDQDLVFFLKQCVVTPNVTDPSSRAAFTEVSCYTFTKRCVLRHINVYKEAWCGPVVTPEQAIFFQDIYFVRVTSTQF